MLLRDRVAVIYGAGGAVGGAAARAFAGEGARVFVTGRSLAPVEAVAEGIVAGGGLAEAAQVDALDERAVDRHLGLGRGYGTLHDPQGRSPAPQAPTAECWPAGFGFPDRRLSPPREPTLPQSGPRRLNEQTKPPPWLS